MAELINKQVSKRHRAKYLDIGYNRYGIEILTGTGGGASHLGALYRTVRRSGVSAWWGNGKIMNTFGNTSM